MRGSDIRLFWPVVVLLSCGSPDGDSKEVPPEVQSSPYVLLDGAEQLTRISTSLRGIRPSLDDYARLEADPAELDALIDEYTASAEFSTVMMDWANATFLARTETIRLPPVIGELEGFTMGDMYRSATAEPLKLVEYIVQEGRPFTDLVTADYMLTDNLVSKMWGVPYDPYGEEWQVSEWTDGRPKAGILSSAWLMVRYQSAGANYHRERADMLADRLLCEAFGTRDVDLGGDVNIADDEAVAEAVATDARCVGCHQALDPLAGYFWGYKPVIRRNEIDLAHTRFDCSWAFAYGDPLPPGFDSDVADFCYPLRQYFPEQEDWWQDRGLREPSFYAMEARDLSDVGQLIADDPRFSRCMSRRIFSYLSSSQVEEAPEGLVLELQQVFEQSDFDVRELAKAIVKSDEYRAAGVKSPDDAVRMARMRPIRPYQFSRTLRDLTGYRWLVDADEPGCEEFGACWGPVDLLESDLYGFRSMQGGIDSYYTIRSEHTITPTKFLTMETVSWDAAGYVVERDFGTDDPEQWRLLTVARPGEADESVVREQMVALFKRMHGTTVTSDGPEVDLLHDVFGSVYASTSNTEDAWTVVIAALIQDPAMMLH